MASRKLASMLLISTNSFWLVGLYLRKACLHFFNSAEGLATSLSVVLEISYNDRTSAGASEERNNSCASSTAWRRSSEPFASLSVSRLVNSVARFLHQLVVETFRLWWHRNPRLRHHVLPPEGYRFLNPHPLLRLFVYPWSPADYSNNPSLSAVYRISDNWNSHCSSQ